MDPHLISVDELRAAGALEVPPAWRKSLAGPQERKQFSLFGDDDLSSDDASTVGDEDAQAADEDDLADEAS